MASTTNFSSPSKENLVTHFVGKRLLDMPVPSAILDVAKVKRNCTEMLEAARELQVSFRAHIKTHKTQELTRLQIGEGNQDVRLLVSTVTEAESILDLLQEYQSKGASIDVLYGVPLCQSLVPRIAALAKKLGPGCISAMIDNPAQIPSALEFKKLTGFPLKIFVKTDSGYHRAGLSPQSRRMHELLDAISSAEQQSDVHLLGLYSHNSLSYNGSNPNEAMDMLKVEIDACRLAAQHLSTSAASRKAPLVVSVGASPTALSIQNLLSSSSTAPSTSSSSSADDLRNALSLTKSDNLELEIHAGVYTTFDLQQVAATSRSSSNALTAHEPIAFTVLAEVTSLYPDRTSSPEALINAGCLALAREPCKSYPGWGVVTAWNFPSTSDSSSTNHNPGSTSDSPHVYTTGMATNSDDSTSRMIVVRISQEHGILGWEDKDKKDELPLRYGQKVRVWPNHACITGAGFGWYLIVDSEGPGKGEIVEDVWVRCTGW